MSRSFLSERSTRDPRLFLGNSRLEAAKDEHHGMNPRQLPTGMLRQRDNYTMQQPYGSGGLTG
jgi:hypothetical protein